MGLFDWLFKKSHSAPPARGWKVGDRVLAMWHDSFFYPGHIRAVHGDTFEVVFDDGDARVVAGAHVIPPDIAVGSRVFSRLKSGPAYLPGIVNQRKGETILVHYDHGEEEWTSISMVRVQRAGTGNMPPANPATTPGKQAADVGEPITDDNWRAGDRVLARWVDFYWYPGTILDMGTRGFHVLYDDGDQRVVPHKDLMPLIIEEGESVYIRPKNEPQRIYAPASVTRVDGETIDVEYEDGHRETNTKVSRCRLWRCPVGVPNFPFDEGDRVLAHDVDGFIYPAEILSIEEDKIVVQFLDGPERLLTPELIRNFELRPRTKVECRWKGGPNYFAGTMAGIDGDRVRIEYDDGDKEWTSVRLVRLPPQSVR
jgi:hypothetical protein